MNCAIHSPYIWITSNKLAHFYFQSLVIIMSQVKAILVAPVVVSKQDITHFHCHLYICSASNKSGPFYSQLLISHITFPAQHRKRWTLLCIVWVSHIGIFHINTLVGKKPSDSSDFVSNRQQYSFLCHPNVCKMHWLQKYNIWTAN